MALTFLGKKNREINKVVLLPLAQVGRNAHQPRRVFGEAAIRELSASIEKNGLLQPITVRKTAEGCYELIAGERRLRAFQALGREVIPAIVEEYTEGQSAVLALIENWQRQDLNCFEEACALADLMITLDLTQQQVSEKLGKAQSTVANKLRLLRLPQEVQARILETGLTERHARALLKLEDGEMQAQAVEYVAAHDLNVQQTEEYMEALLAPQEPPAPSPSRIFVVKDVRLFLNSISRAITLMKDAGIKAEANKHETEDYVEYTVRIPKMEVYREPAKREIQKK